MSAGVNVAAPAAVRHEVFGWRWRKLLDRAVMGAKDGDVVAAFDDQILNAARDIFGEAGAVKVQRGYLTVQHPDQVLGEIERQLKYLRRVHLAVQQCPNCGERFNLYDAAGCETTAAMLELDRSAGGEYACPKCESPLEHVVPMQGPWRFARKQYPGRAVARVENGADVETLPLHQAAAVLGAWALVTDPHGKTRTVGTFVKLFLAGETVQVSDATSWRPLPPEPVQEKPDARRNEPQVPAVRPGAVHGRRRQGPGRYGPGPGRD